MPTRAFHSPSSAAGFDAMLGHNGVLKTQENLCLMNIPLNSMAAQLAPLSVEQQIQAMITMMEQLRICNYVTGE